MNLRITIKDELSPRLQNLMRAFTAAGRAALNRAAGTEVQTITRDHIERLKRKSGSLASKHGAPASNHYKDAAAKVGGTAALNADPEAATLTINHVGFSRAFRDVKIVPRTAQTLALPINPAAFGHRPKELWDTLQLFIPKGEDGKPLRVIAAAKGGVITPMYVLCKSVTQKQDRTLLPSDEDFRKAAVRGALGFLLREGGKI